MGRSAPVGNRNATRLFLSVGGKDYTIEQASKKFGVSYWAIRRRLIKGLKGDHAIVPTKGNLKRGNVNAGIRVYKLVMHDFYTKSHRLQCYKELVKQMKELRMKIAA